MPILTLRVTAASNVPSNLTPSSSFLPAFLLLVFLAAEKLCVTMSASLRSLSTFLPSSLDDSPFFSNRVSFNLNRLRHIQMSRLPIRAGNNGGGDNGSLELPASHKAKLASFSALERLKISSPDRYTREKSSILVLGLSVHSTPVEMREKLSIPEAEWPRAIAELCNLPHIEEAAVLSTCNRMEIYVVALSWHRGVREVTEWMSKTSGISVPGLREHLFLLRDRDATQHLFRVASGLDSLVLGEGQILAQVKHVYKVGQAANGFGRNLSGLFKQAITAGKRVRTETSIAAGAVSVSSAAVELAAMKLLDNGFSHARVMIVGAGKMAKLLVKHLISKGCMRIVIVNRTEQRVTDLQMEFEEAQILFEPFDQMIRCTGEADLVFTSTASESPLFYKENIECLPPAGDHVNGIRYFVDISVPRNVSACVGHVTAARVYNVDDLKEVVAANKEERRRKALEAQVIIDEELKSFESWRDSLETVPTIKKLRAYAEHVRLGELEKCLSKLGDDLSKKEKKLIDEMSRGIVNKLLHGPMTHLRCDEASGRNISETLENMQALERMFSLKSDLSSLGQQLRTKVDKIDSLQQ